jgi:hypothetical protein
MELIEAWSVRIAQAVAPDEIDLAPEMARAFLSGGKDRAELFNTSESGSLGGFGAGDVAVIFPIVLKWIVSAGGLLITFLSAPETGTLLTTVESLINIKDKLARQKKVAELPQNPYGTLKQVQENFAAGLKATGLEQDQCEILTYRFMQTLLADPKSAQEYIQKIQASAPVGQAKKKG